MASQLKLSKASLTTISAYSLIAILFTAGNSVIALGKSQQTKSKSSSSESTKASLEQKKLSEIFRKWLSLPTLKHSMAGLELTNVKTGDVIYSYNGRRRFTPASTVKAITCACAYDLIKPNFTFTTSLVAEGAVKPGGILEGNLVLVPSQDPTFMRANLVKLVQQAKTKEIAPGLKLKRITGRVIIKKPALADGGFHPSWLVEDWGRHWMPVSSNLVVDRNITYTSGLIPKVKVLNANSMHGELFARALTQRGGPGWVYLDPRRKIQFVYHSNHPQNAKSATLTVSNPDQFNRELLEQLVIQNGITVDGKNVKLSESDSVIPLSSHNSYPLSNIIKRTLHKSDNLYAQQLLRTIGLKYIASREKINSEASLEEYGITGLQNWLNKVGVSAHEVILYDGCGLCRKNGVSPHALNEVMRYMAKEESTRGYLDLLKASDDTKNHKGIYKFKTGTMDSIRAISGVLTTAGNQNFALTIMANGHSPSIRDLRIAMSGLINQLRVIKHIGEKMPKVEVATDNDPGLTTTSTKKVLVDTKALNQQPAKQKKKKRSRSRQRKKNR